MEGWSLVIQYCCAQSKPNSSAAIFCARSQKQEALVGVRDQAQAPACRLGRHRTGSPYLWARAICLVGKLYTPTEEMAHFCLASWSGFTAQGSLSGLAAALHSWHHGVLENSRLLCATVHCKLASLRNAFIFKIKTH